MSGSAASLVEFEMDESGEARGWTPARQKNPSDATERRCYASQLQNGGRACASGHSLSLRFHVRIICWRSIHTAWGAGRQESGTGGHGGVWTGENITSVGGTRLARRDYCETDEAPQCYARTGLAEQSRGGAENEGSLVPSTRGRPTLLEGPWSRVGVQTVAAVAEASGSATA